MPLEETHPRPRSLHQPRNILEKLQKRSIPFLKRIKINHVERAQPYFRPQLLILENFFPRIRDQPDVRLFRIFNVFALFGVGVAGREGALVKLDVFEVGDGVGVGFDDRVIRGGIRLELGVDLRMSMLQR